VEAKVVRHPDKIIHCGTFTKAPVLSASQIMQNRASQSRNQPALNISPVVAAAALARLKLLALHALLVKAEADEVSDKPNGEQCQAVKDCVGHQRMN
jgi:hypothetical protein